jgi:spectinomycin phosphotransferase
VREPPVNLPSDTLCACLRTNYGLAVTDLTFLPLGHDSSAWVYTALAPDLAQLMQRETFVPAGAAMVRELEAHMAGRTFADPAAQALATVWHERRDDIHTLVARAEELGRRLAQRAPAFVLCHADIHTANVLLDGGGQVWIVDWDDTVLAPKERDLMFVVGGGISRRLVGPREEELFLQGYGATTVDPLALAYYRYAWAVSDIGEYGAQVFLRSDLGAVTRRAAVDRFMSLFLPGNIVALAFASDDRVA